MASPINCLSILVIPLLVTSLFYQVSVGQKLTDADLQSLCQKTSDPNFCFTTLKADPRTFLASGDLNHLGLVTIAILIDTVQVEVDEIPGILKKLGDRVDKSRMEACEYDYNNALKILRDAYASFGEKNYNGAKSLIINAGLQQEVPPVLDLELEATQDPDPESSSSSSVSSNSGGDEESGRLSQPQVANEIRRGLRLRLEILRAGFSKVACRVWNWAACARGFWSIASVTGVAAAVLLSFLYVRVQRWRQVLYKESKDRLIRERDEVLSEKLHNLRPFLLYSKI
uniref:Pectinesterase inhibitor domain-containing protein n=1 Tax=Quercus lobata TaxID=97700 RepID=A0A7N2L9N1_QUELO